MNNIYIEENGCLKYFIHCCVDKIEEAKETISVKNIKKVQKGAFQNLCNFKNILFDDQLETIEENAFRNCEGLELFVCGKFSTLEAENCFIRNFIAERLKFVEIREEKFQIQTSAFSGCSNLTTVILPKFTCSDSKLIIEKDSFKECYSLRTVIALVDKAVITDNPFKDCPKELTFICPSNSDIERFARENGYRFINVQQPEL